MHKHSNGNDLRILMQIKAISLTIVELQDSLRNRDQQQLAKGTFNGQSLILPDECGHILAIRNRAVVIKR